MADATLSAPQETTETRMTADATASAQQEPTEIRKQHRGHHCSRDRHWDAWDDDAAETGWTHYLVLDFEATCERDDKTQKHWSEIIEFPCVLVNADGLEVVSEFSTFVQPTGRPKLTAFCTELTSITQADVDLAPLLEDVLRSFNRWLPSALGSDDTSCVLPVTCGESDLSSMLPRECERKGLRVPAVLQRYCNIKIPFRRLTATKKMGMDGMLQQLNLPLVGRHHRGIDDARNIARIAMKLAQLGGRIDQTGGCTQG